MQINKSFKLRMKLKRKEDKGVLIQDGGRIQKRERDEKDREKGNKR